MTLTKEWFDTLPTPCWLKDINGYIIYVNTSYIDLFGLPDNILTSNCPQDIWGEKTSEEFALSEAKVIETDEPLYLFEKIVIPSTQENKMANMIKWPLHDKNGTIVGVVGIILNAF